MRTMSASARVLPLESVAMMACFLIAYRPALESAHPGRRCQARVRSSRAVSSRCGARCFQRSSARISSSSCVEMYKAREHARRLWGITGPGTACEHAYLSHHVFELQLPWTAARDPRAVYSVSEMREGCT